LSSFGIPYVFAYGNHDESMKSTHTKKDINNYLFGRSGCFMKDNERNKDITGKSNNIVKLRNSDGSINSLIITLDSNEYTKHKHKRVYDYIRNDQVIWYGEEIERITAEESEKISVKKSDKISNKDSEGISTEESGKESKKIVPSYVFFHIPLQEYKEGWEKAERHSEKYFYGSRDEKISFSPIRSNIFDKAVEMKSTKAMFCGHDHLNDFSVEYKGIRLTYGQSIDCLLYTKNLSEHKGATLLTIKENGDFDIQPIKDI